MLNSDVFRNAVSAPASAAERERRSEFEVIKIADTALRRRSVYEDSARFHAGSKLVELSLFGLFVEVNRRSVTESAVRDKLFRFGEGVLNILGFIHCKNGRKFFVSEFFRKVYAFDFAYKNLRSFGNGYARERGYRNGLLSYDFSVERAVDDYRLSNFFDFFAL